MLSWIALTLVLSMNHAAFPPQDQLAGGDARSARLLKAVHDDQIGTAAALIDELQAAKQSLPTLPDGRTLLHIAAENASAGMITMLLAHGLDVNVTDSLGRTALHRAHSLTAPALIDAHANWVALDSLGNTPLHYAAEQSAASCAILVDKGLPVDARNNAGLSPLHFATLSGEKSAVEYLLDHGANINAKTLAAYDYLPWWLDADANKPRRIAAGRTPLDVARLMHAENKWSSGRHRAIVELLEARGGTANARVQAFAPKRLIYIAISIASLFVMLWGLLLLDARVTGWHALAGRFVAQSTPANINAHQDGGVGRLGLVHLKSLLRAAATDDGLYIAFPGWLSAGHPPLIIPWSELTIASDKSLLGIEVLELRAARDGAAGPPGELIVLRGGIVPEVRNRLRP